MLCRTPEQRDKDCGMQMSGSGRTEGVLNGNRLMGGRAALQRVEICNAGFLKEMLNHIFLFLITKQYLLTTEKL